MTSTAKSMMQNSANMALSPMDIAEMILGFQRTQILYTACSLGIFEELTSTSLPTSASNISNSLGTDPDATERLMNACVGLKLLEKELNPDGVALYRNSPAAQCFLVRSSPMSMRPLLTTMGPFYSMWDHLKDGVKDGKGKIPCHMGVNSNFLENSFFMNDSRKHDFLQTMHMFSSIDAPMVLKAFDLSEFKVICDLGGGTGALGVHWAKSYPKSKVTVFDLDHVIKAAARFMPKDKPENVVTKAGDFFKDPLPTADLYVLSHVIHDWGEEKINQLLRKVHRSLKPGGAVLILEKFLTEQKDGPMDTLLFDIGMVLLSDGRERSATEYTSLLRQNGFHNISFKVLPQAKWHDVILARKSEPTDSATS